MTDIPSSVPTVVVAGRFVRSAFDGSDTDTALIGVPAQGTVTLTPLVDRIRVPASAPPATLFPKEAVCTLDGDGYLVGPSGARGIEVVATGISFAAYRIEFDFIGVARLRFNAPLPAGQPIDLANVLELPSDVTVDYSHWVAAASRAEAAAGRAEIAAERAERAVQAMLSTAITSAS